MSKFWTAEGWEAVLRDYLGSSASIDDKMRLVESYVEWMVEDSLDCSCDSCERISVDDIGEYLADRISDYYDR